MEMNEQPPAEGVMDFMVFYWLEQGDKRHALSERLCANSRDEVVEMVMEKLNKRYFHFNSDTEGYVIVQSEHVRYVEIENGNGGGCAPNELPVGF